MNSTLIKIENGDLYALLSVCSNEDLDPIVKCITGKFWNFLEVDDEYKKYAPCHTRYYRAIGDHLRRYGGNSLNNARRGEGPGYERILVDVCEKLGIPNKPGAIVANEGSLLKFYFEGRWEALSWEQREKLIEKIRVKAAEDAVDMKARLMPGGIKKIAKNRMWAVFAMAPAVLAAEFIAPIALGAAAFRFADPNLRVTAFCVLHIAYLRRKFLETARHSSSESSRSTAVLAICNSATSSSPEADHDALIIGESEDRPILSISEIVPPLAQRKWSSVSHTGEGISRLNPLLQAVPSLATAAEVAGAFGTKYMKVVADGPLVAKASGAGYTSMVRNATGIRSQATLFDPTQLASLVTPAAIFQIASMAVAQKHLADISEKLNEIRAVIDKINFHLQEGRRSTATGAIGYFEQVAPSVLAGELSGAVRHQIENHEAELLKMQEHVLVDVRRQIKEIIEITFPFELGSEASHQAIERHQETLDNLYGQLLLCLRARGCGWQLLLAFPGEDGLKESRKRDIRSALNSLQDSGELLKQTDDLMRQKIRELSSMWNTKLTVNDRKMNLLDWSPKLFSEIAEARERMLEEIQAADTAMSGLKGPVSLLAKVEGGRIVAISPLSQEELAIAR